MRYMLLMFRTKNFSSFKNDVVLDLRKTSFREHPNHVFNYKDFSLLKTVAIFGPNASGKSNLISALSTFEDFIINQMFKKLEDKDFDSDLSLNKNISMEPFLLTNKVDNEIEFEIIFGNNDYLYQYGYSVEKTKILTEWLFINNELVFERDKDNKNLVFGQKYIGLLKMYDKVRDDRLYISILDYFAVEDELRDIMDKFKEFFYSKFNIYFELLLESSVKGKAMSLNFHENLLQNEPFRQKVSEYIRKIDVGIKEIIIDEEIITSRRTGKEEKRLIIKAVHSIYDEVGNIIGEEAFDLKYESSGTIRFLSFIQEILRIIDNGGVFIVDEMSSRLHPLLTKFIVDIFQSKINKKNAQLIFTTHDVTLMNKDQFRRDEVVFVDKDDKGKSTVYSLADLGVRPDATFNKDYFRGKFGAIPIVDYFLLSDSGEKKWQD